VTAARHYPLVSFRVAGVRRVAGCACGMRGSTADTAVHLQKTTTDGWIL
jgi:hypothetical protein